MKKPRKKLRAAKTPTVGCECGGKLRPARLPSYDLSGLLGFPAVIRDIPGLKCDGCKGETISGGQINALLKYLLVRVATFGRRLSGDEARFLRRSLGVTQQELATRMGIARETVAKWETGDPLSPQSDFVLRAIVLASALEHGVVPEGYESEVWTTFRSVRTLPATEEESVDFGTLEHVTQGARERAIA